MDSLEEYYIKSVRIKNDIEFKDLTEDDKIHYSGTLGFAVYQVNEATKKFSEAVKPFLNKNGVIED